MVLITGASRGLGAGLAGALAARGARVALVGLEGSRLKQLAEAIGPKAALWQEADVTDPVAMERAVALTEERFGRLDCVVANAGIATFSTLATMDNQHFSRVLEVNVMGTWNIMRASLPALTRWRGYFLAVASGAAVIPIAGMGPYNASKAAVESLCDTLRMEASHRGVSVGVAYFSFMDTDMVAQGRSHPGLDKVRLKMPAPLRAVYPPERAIEALVRGVEKRSARVIAPKILGLFMPLRWLLCRLLPYGSQAYMAEVEQICQDHPHLQGSTEPGKAC